jgi:hypothetical protein
MIEARTLMPQTGFPEYVTSIERLRRVGDGATPDVQYRFSFYARGRSGT